MAKSTSYPVCKKKFTSSSHHKSVVTLESNHLVFCVDQQFIERKIYYKEIYSAQIQRVNHIFYFISALILLMQVFIYLVLNQMETSLYPDLSFILMSIFLICIVLYGKCLYVVRVNRMGADTYVFYTSRRKEARAVVLAINETLKKLSE